MIGLAMGFAVASFMVACVSACVAAWAIIEVMAYKRSTHQVQFVSAGDEARELAEDKAINRDLSDGEYDAMLNAFGDRRRVKDEEGVN